MPRARLLHVLTLAPAAALLAAGLSGVASPAAAASVPPPTVVCVDAGAGGADPGVVGLDGMVEKNIALDVATRLRGLLSADGATVVMTRTADQSVSIQQRTATCNGAHASALVSVQFNAFTDPSAEGSLILYPSAHDQPFARAMQTTLSAFLSGDAVRDGGLRAESDEFLQMTMPTIIVDSLFLTNPHDVQLLGQSRFRQGLATAMRNGVEAYLPAILQRKDDLRTATPGTHPGAAAVPTGRPLSRVAGQRGSGLPGIVVAFLWLLLLFGLALAVRHRRRLLPVLGRAAAGASAKVRASGLHHRLLRRRRRLLRGRASGEAGSAESRPSPARARRRYGVPAVRPVPWGGEAQPGHPPSGAAPGGGVDGHSRPGWPDADSGAEGEVDVRGRRAPSVLDRLPF